MIRAPKFSVWGAVLAFATAGDFPDSDGTSRRYTIREMARDFQVSIRTLRFYEDRGLLHPRREGTNRRYDSRDRLRLKIILKGKSLGFTLSEITDILASQGEASGKMDLEMGLLPEQINAQIDHLERQRNQIDEAIKTLRTAQRHLLELPPRGRGPGSVRPVAETALLSRRRAQALSVSLTSLLRA